ncbi:MAG: hypothetical protein ACREDR_30255 [Blastocatellia bacterium]
MTDLNRQHHPSPEFDRREEPRTTGPTENPANQGRVIEFPLTRNNRGGK